MELTKKIFKIQFIFVGNHETLRLGLFKSLTAPDFSPI
jgi:hypothetical protein